LAGLSPTRLQRDPEFSPDGRRIAFTSDRSGNLEIWVSDSGGSNAVQLTDFRGSRTAGAPRWSPDGRRVAFDSGSGDSFDIYVIDAEGGAARQVAAGMCVRPSWSHDGHWIYFGSDLPGANQVWKIPAEGGQAVQVTHSGGLEAFESLDGKTLYFSRRFNQRPGVMSVPGEGGTEALVIESARMGYWAVTDRGIWFLDFAARSGRGPVPLRFYSFEKHQVTQVGSIAIGVANLSDASFSVTRDGSCVIWRQTDLFVSDLMLVENFR
jgi:Tol biopolymer transport system component